MGLNTSKLSSRRVTDFIPVQDFTGFKLSAPTVTIAGDESGTVAIGISSDANGAALSKTTSTNRTGITGVQRPLIVTAGTATGNEPRISELNSVGLMGLLMYTANPTTGDDIRHMMRIPDKWNRQQDIRFRVIWMSESNTAGDGITWLMLYSLMTLNSSSVAAPATALDTPIAEDEVISQDLLMASPTGILNAGKITNEDYISLLIRLSAFDAGMTEPKFLVGLEVEYTPRQGKYPRSLPGNVPAEAA